MPVYDIGLQTPEQILIEVHGENDACDVIVRMEDGTVYTASFVTLSYFHRQMELQYRLSCELHDTPPARYAAVDTAHIVVERLDREAIEDTIDNLIALDVFEGHFTRVTQNGENHPQRTTDDGKLATKEVAAVVISDVLVVDE